MDIQTRKIEFVQEFLKIDNEETLTRLERLLKKEKKSRKLPPINPMSLEELNRRIDKSMIDSKNEKFTETGDLVVEIEKWR